MGHHNKEVGDDHVNGDDDDSDVIMSLDKRIR